MLVIYSIVNKKFSLPCRKYVSIAQYLPSMRNKSKHYSDCAVAQYRECIITLGTIPTILLSSKHNTDYATQIYAQYLLCCSALSTILIILFSSMLNIDISVHHYAQYRLYCSDLCSILTILLSSNHNTDCAAQLYAQYRQCCSALSTILTNTIQLSSMLKTYRTYVLCFSAQLLNRYTFFFYGVEV